VTSSQAQEGHGNAVARHSGRSHWAWGQPEGEAVRRHQRTEERTELRHMGGGRHYKHNSKSPKGFQQGVICPSASSAQLPIKRTWHENQEGDRGKGHTGTVVTAAEIPLLLSDK
jgi:hypothetical protein